LWNGGTGGYSAQKCITKLCNYNLTILIPLRVQTDAFKLQYMLQFLTRKSRQFCCTKKKTRAGIYRTKQAHKGVPTYLQSQLRGVDKITTRHRYYLLLRVVSKRNETLPAALPIFVGLYCIPCNNMRKWCVVAVTTTIYVLPPPLIRVIVCGVEGQAAYIQGIQGNARTQ
jgi:hypothetical protein